MSRGNAIIEVLVLGFLGALIVLQGVVVTGRLQSAGDEATEVAQAAAAWAARSGNPAAAEAMAHELLPEAEVTATGNGTMIRVVVETSVSLIGPDGSPIRTTVRGRAEARISPYRSNHG